VTAFTFLKDGAVRYTGRFVETEYFLREQEADTILYRNAFGTEKESTCPFQNAFDFDLKNVANTVRTNSV
jgi:all-trans-8'-apo-beta-carotenal 15,15'-oxygenase